MTRNLTFFLFLIFIGCSSDQNTLKFTIEVIQPGSYGDLLMISGTTGQLVYEGADRNGIIEVQLSDGEIADLTFGTLDVNNSFSYLRTIRGIRSNYQFSGFSSDCWERANAVSGQFEVTITGLIPDMQYDILCMDRYDRSIQKNGSSLMIAGAMPFDQVDELFSIKSTGALDYKNFVVRFEDWVVMDGVSKYEIDWKDMDSFSDQVVELEEPAWKHCFGYAKLVDGDIVALSDDGTYNDYGNAIRLFEVADVQEYHFNFEQSVAWQNMSSTRMRSSELPTEVSIYNPEINVVHSDFEYYDIDEITDADIVILELSFSLNTGTTLAWSIVQLASDGLNYSLPSLSELERLNLNGQSFMDKYGPELTHTRIQVYRNVSGEPLETIKSKSINMNCFNYEHNNQLLDF